LSTSCVDVDVPPVAVIFPVVVVVVSPAVVVVFSVVVGVPPGDVVSPGDVVTPELQDVQLSGFWLVAVSLCEP
jgi:hypothetical protein